MGRINIQKKEYKLYTLGWIIFATILGGPLAGIYMLSENFTKFAQVKYAKNTILFGIVGTILLFALITILPNSIIDKLPSSIIPILYTSLIVGIFTKYQDKAVKEYIQSGGKKVSGWRALGIAILSLILSMFYFLVLVILFP